jgi:4-hydroxybenzoate polyprenyltransferase
MRSFKFFQLMRLHKPVGIALLWFPTAWALWIANNGAPKWSLLCYFFLGTVLMRSVGCVINDIADRHIDKHVSRTKTRPITCGDVSVLEAFMLLFLLLAGSFAILLQLPKDCFYYAVFAVLITFFYPFCKRFFQAPQVILSLAFSMGIPMAYVASGIAPNKTMWILFFINAAWIVAYDTMYAMVDRPDDLRLGVKSTAVLFAQYDCFIIFLLQLLFHGGWLYLALSLRYSLWFYSFWVFASILLVYQQILLKNRQPDHCFRAFSSNSWYGFLMWLALFVY